MPEINSNAIKAYVSGGIIIQSESPAKRIN